MILDMLQIGFKKAKEEKADLFLLFFTGHGYKDTGAWITSLLEANADFNSNMINIEEILETI